MNIGVQISDSLVERCQSGDETAYDEVYSSCAKGVFNSILRIVKQREEAEDLLQETFISAFENMYKFRGDSSLFGWIKKIGVNKSLNAIKKRKLEFGLLESDLLDEDLEENDWQKLKLNAGEILQNLNQLSDGFRLVLTLYLFEGYSHKEIADELGISESTSKTQYLRGKKKLKEQLLAAYEGK